MLILDGNDAPLPVTLLSSLGVLCLQEGQNPITMKLVKILTLLVIASYLTMGDSRSLLQDTVPESEEPSDPTTDPTSDPTVDPASDPTADSPSDPAIDSTSVPAIAPTQTSAVTCTTDDYIGMSACTDFATAAASTDPNLLGGGDFGELH